MRPSSYVIIKHTDEVDNSCCCPSCFHSSYRSPPGGRTSWCWVEIRLRREGANFISPPHEKVLSQATDFIKGGAWQIGVCGSLSYVCWFHYLYGFDTRTHSKGHLGCLGAQRTNVQPLARLISPESSPGDIRWPSLSDVISKTSRAEWSLLLSPLACHGTVQFPRHSWWIIHTHLLTLKTIPAPRAIKASFNLHRVTSNFTEGRSYLTQQWESLSSLNTRTGREKQSPLRKF